MMLISPRGSIRPTHKISNSAHASILLNQVRLKAWLTLLPIIPVCLKLIDFLDKDNIINVSYIQYLKTKLSIIFGMGNKFVKILKNIFWQATKFLLCH